MRHVFTKYFCKERHSIPGDGLDKPTDRDQPRWIFLNYPKNTLLLTEKQKNNFRKAKP